ncbi:MAG: hypothetical protein ACT4NY_04535 [Pseudonocardiales bacterium]
MGKHDANRDGQGDAQLEKWENWGSKDDGNQHEGDNDEVDDVEVDDDK